jgi:hypothetical protein
MPMQFIGHQVIHLTSDTLHIFHNIITPLHNNNLEILKNRTTFTL